MAGGTTLQHVICPNKEMSRAKRGYRYFSIYLYGNNRPSFKETGE